MVSQERSILQTGVIQKTNIDAENILVSPLMSKTYFPLNGDIPAFYMEFDKKNIYDAYGDEVDCKLSQTALEQTLDFLKPYLVVII